LPTTIRNIKHLPAMIDKSAGIHCVKKGEEIAHNLQFFETRVDARRQQQ
jgi:hypothetical protein